MRRDGNSGRRERPSPQSISGPTCGTCPVRALRPVQRARPAGLDPACSTGGDGLSGDDTGAPAAPPRCSHPAPSGPSQPPLHPSRVSGPRPPAARLRLRARRPRPRAATGGGGPPPDPAAVRPTLRARATRMRRPERASNPGAPGPASRPGHHDASGDSDRDERLDGGSSCPSRQRHWQTRGQWQRVCASRRYGRKPIRFGFRVPL